MIIDMDCLFLILFYGVIIEGECFFSVLNSEKKNIFLNLKGNLNVSY